MKRAALLALAAASLGRVELARAGSRCGGGGGHSSGGGGHSSGGGYSSGGSSSSSSSDSRPACVDETDVVGYRHCTKFASWATRSSDRALHLDFGTAVRTFTSPLDEATGTLSHEDESFTYRVTGAPSTPSAPPSSETAVLATARADVDVTNGFFLGLEGELGGLARSASRVEMTSTGMFGAPSIRPSSSLVYGGLAIAGLRGQAGGLVLGAELAAGIRSITYYYESRYLACQMSTSQKVTSPILEARARASRWVSPFVNVGVSAGASVIDRGAWVAGLHLGVVTKAYANMSQ